MSLTDGLLISHPPLDTWTSLRPKLSLTDSLLFSEPDAITVLELGLQRLVYISARGDGRPGKGTLSDPFNGSTADKFDALMRSIPEFSEIILLPGVYPTRGYSNNRGALLTPFDPGWKAKPGWKLRGCGIGVTIVKLVECDTAGFNYCAITGFWTNESDPSLLYRNFVEVSDLTIDCNGAGNYPQPNHDLPSAKSGTIEAIKFSGGHVRISRVRCINWMSGKWITVGVGVQIPGECFVMGINGPIASLNPFQPHMAQYIIEDCIVEQPYWVDNMGATGIQISGGGLSDGSLTMGYYGTIQRCYIDGQFPTGQKYGYPSDPQTPGRFGFNGIGFGMGHGYIYQDNRIVNVASAGPYLDTGLIKENIVRDNIYHNVFVGPNYTIGGTQERSVSKFQSFGTFAEVTTYYDHLQLDGQRVDISCPSNTNFNVLRKPITVTGRRTFTYPLVLAPTIVQVSPESGKFTAQWAGEKLVVENNDLSLARITDPEYAGVLYGFRPTGINVHAGAVDPPQGEYMYEEVVVRGNRIRLMDNDMNTANEAYLGIAVRDTRRAIIEDNIIRLPLSRALAGFGTVQYVDPNPVINPKAHIGISNVGSFICRNNKRPEDNSFILPLVSKQGGADNGSAAFTIVTSIDALHIDSITHAAGVATVTLNEANPNYEMKVGDFVNVSGVTISPEFNYYNGGFVIREVISPKVFKYNTVVGAPALAPANSAGIISSLTSVTTTATAILPYPNYKLITGTIVEIVGATPSGYNGSYPITVVSPTQFTYTIVSVGGVPATGTLEYRTPIGLLFYNYHRFAGDMEYEPQKMAALLL